MKRSLVIIAIALLFCIFGFIGADNLFTISVNAKSSSDKLAAKYSVIQWNKNAKLVSISITNTGDVTELIKDIQIKLNNPPSLNEDSKILYGSSEMNSRSAIKQCGIHDKQHATESVFLVKNGEKKYFKLGVLTWEIFRASITFSKEKGITISAEGENKPIKPGETIQFEKLVMEEGENWQDLLFDYGKQIAKYHNIKPKEIGKWNGYGTWDYYGHDYTYEDVKSNTEQIKKIFPGANVIQLDASWWVNRGDYLETRSTLPGGMKGMAKLINDNGCIAGLHIDGFRGIHTSKIFQEHPDWFLKDQDGNTIFGPYSRNGKAEKRVYFDYSNPAACEYIKNVLKTMTNDWGYKYIKVDFLAYGLNRNILDFQKDPNLKEIVAFDTTMTSIERSRAGLKAMREGIGNNYFLGCSSVFGPNFGLIDGLRTGPDIDPRFDAYKTHQLQNAGNFYLNQSVVQTDADYLVVRNKDDEDSTRAQGRNKFGGDVTLNEAKMWTDYVTLFGGVKLSSDDLNLLRPERKELVKKAFSIKTCTRFIPIDLWDKARSVEDAFNIILGTNDQGVYLALFNWNNQELGIILSKIPTDKLEVVNQNEPLAFKIENQSLDVQLKPHSSVIIKLNSSANFDKVRKQISYKFN